MTQCITPSRASGLVALAVALAVLLGSFATAAAQAAISKPAQANRAAGQASFFCYAWRCQSRSRTAAAYSGGTLKTVWRLNNVRGIFGRPNCRTYVIMAINVTSAGAVTSRLVTCR